jgi:Porin subfamily
MIRNGLRLIVVAALSASPLMAQSSTPPKTPKPVPDKVLPMKGTARVNSCAAYGPGFVKVEGTDTCVQIGGSISIGVGGSTGGRR